MRFEFATSTRILFGPGEVRAVAPAAKQMGRQALLVLGRSAESAAFLVEALKLEGIGSVSWPIQAEPSVSLVRQGAELARQEQCDLVIAFGGGSAIDAGKAIAALLT